MGALMVHTRWLLLIPSSLVTAESTLVLITSLREVQPENQTMSMDRTISCVYAVGKSIWLESKRLRFDSWLDLYTFFCLVHTTRSWIIPLVMWPWQHITKFLLDCTNFGQLDQHNWPMYALLLQGLLTTIRKCWSRLLEVSKLSKTIIP